MATQFKCEAYSISWEKTGPFTAIITTKLSGDDIGGLPDDHQS